jgi:ribonuclease VapC
LILFVDASAMVAVLTPEEDSERFEGSMSQATRLLFSPVAAWETTVTLCRGKGLPEDQARERLESFLHTFEVEMVPIGDLEGRAALDAFLRYGKGRHPAQLNMGDCFAYACAKTNSARLLYKGDDFSHTDLA